MTKRKHIKGPYDVKGYILKLLTIFGIGILGISPINISLMSIANDISMNIKLITFPILTLLFLISNIWAFLWLKKYNFEYYGFYILFGISMLIYLLLSLTLNVDKHMGYIFFGTFIVIFSFYFLPLWIQFRKFKIERRA